MQPGRRGKTSYETNRARAGYVHGQGVGNTRADQVVRIYIPANGTEMERRGRGAAATAYISQGSAFC